MERNKTLSVSFAPEVGEIDPIERLLFRSKLMVVNNYPALTVTAWRGHERMRYDEPLITTANRPIDVETALRLACLHLLARLENE